MTLLQTGYPPSRHVDAKDTLHGVVVPDPFRWLEDAKSTEVQKWMTAQDDFARARLAKLPGREELAKRLRELFYIDSISAPIHRGTRYFYTRRHADKEKPIVYWREGKKGAEKVLFDPNTWSTDGSVALHGWEPTWDGKRVAYRKSQNNSDESTMYVMDVATGKDSDIDVIEGAKYATASWTPRGDGFYYTWLPTDPKIPTADRPGFAEVRFHKLGTDPKNDPIIHERTNDASTFIGAHLSRDGHWLLLWISRGWHSEDVYFRDARKPSTEWKPLVVGREALFNIWAWKDRFYTRTNDGSPFWRMDVIDPRKPERTDWKTIVPERDREPLAGFAIVGGRLALHYFKDVVGRLEIHELDGKLVREVPTPGIGSVGTPLGLEDEDDAYYVFTSYTTPTEIYSTSMKTGKSELYFRVKVPVDVSPYEVEQAFFTSKDGTRVPMFIVRRKDLKKDGSTPALLTGYGGFNSPETPGFDASIFPWLEHGGLYAVVNLRGGSEYGEGWHEAGMKLKKQNVFDDFIGAAEFLIKNKYTSASKLAISGGSNGGLLMGAALTQRPDLFRAVVCAVPLLDMVRYHLFGSGKTWIGEYGSAEKADEFKAIFAYSPYHHVKKGTKYPAVLMDSADADDRVDPMHARKFAAALQEASSGGPVWLRIEKHSGHGGADLIKAWVDRMADRYAFLFRELGVAL
jgi:prolyl oligopeptidase